MASYARNKERQMLSVRQAWNIFDAWHTHGLNYFDYLGKIHFDKYHPNAAHFSVSQSVKILYISYGGNVSSAHAEPKYVNNLWSFF